MAFTGVATYDVYANEIGESVSDLVALVSPNETPFLDDVGDQSMPIEAPVYTWLDKALLPDTFTMSSAIASSAATSYGIEIGANANLVRVGDILRSSKTITGVYEAMAVTSIGASAATIYVTRAYAGTTANSAITAGDTLAFVGSALEEGAGVRTQRRVKKTIKTNFVQTFREDINLSNLEVNAKPKSAGQMPDPFEEEVADKTKDIIKQLEKTVLMGRTNGNTIGAANAETTMAGIYYSIATNVVSHATFSNSIFNNLVSLVDAQADVRANASNYTIYAGTLAHRLISNQIAGRIAIPSLQTGQVGLAPATQYFTDFGAMDLKYTRWLPTGSALIIRKDFIKVKPFRGNSFASKQFDLGALAKTGYVAGTYGVEFHQEAAHGRFDGLAA